MTATKGARTSYYIEVDGKPRRPASIDDWIRWIREFDCTVAEDVIGRARIRTVFLGYDASGGAGSALYQTYIVGGPLHGRIRRYPTRDDATAGHYEAVGRCLAAAARLGLGTADDED